MKLVNTKTGFVLLELFQNGKTLFHDRFLEAEMKETGIFIPHPFLSEYGKEVIFFGEELFEKAFVEVYYPLCIANALYQWENS